MNMPCVYDLLVLLVAIEQTSAQPVHGRVGLSVEFWVEGIQRRLGWVVRRRCGPIRLSSHTPKDLCFCIQWNSSNSTIL